MPAQEMVIENAICKLDVSGLDRLRTALVKKYATPGEALVIDDMVIATQDLVARILFPIGSIILGRDRKLLKILDVQCGSIITRRGSVKIVNVKIPESRVVVLKTVSLAHGYSEGVCVTIRDPRKACEAMINKEEVTIYLVDNQWCTYDF
jgi:hypothetical protein